MELLTTQVPRRRDLSLLLAGEVGAIRMPGFIDEETCDRVLSGLSPVLLKRYAPDRYPVEAYRFGPTLNEYRTPDGLDGAYWTAASEARQAWEGRLARSGLREHLVARLREAWGQSVSGMTLGGREVHWPVIRDISQGTLMHWDDLAREYPSGVFDRIVHEQFALNVFVSAPERGGELRIWRRGWEPADENHRIAFGYASQVVSAAPHLTVHAQRCDAILFRSRNYHDVLPSRAGKRITVALFAGVTDTGLVVWS